MSSVSLSTSSNSNFSRFLSIIWACVSAAGSFFLGQLFAGLIIVVSLVLSGLNEKEINDLFDTNSLMQLIFMFVVSGITVVLVVLLLKLFKEPIRNALLLHRKITPKQILEVFGVYVLYFICVVIVSILADVFTAVDVTQTQELGVAEPSNGISLIATFIMLAVLPPIYEEILFRGYLYGRLIKYAPKLPSIVLTSILFGIAHLEYGNLNWIAAIDTFVFSVFLIYISQKHHSLYSAILLHAIKNTIAFYVLFVR